MCGRYTFTDPRGALARFGVEPPPGAEPAARFNVAPTQQVPVVVSGDGARALKLMRWGYQPRWLKGAKRPPPINARAETLAERPLFRGALAAGRCLIPADGYYEWHAGAGRKAKRPYWLHLPDAAPFGFAGIWTPDAEGEPTCAIVTTAAHERIAWLHPRMPVILAPDCEGLWLDPEVRDPLAAASCLTPDAGADLEATPVSSLVSSVRNDGPELLLPLPG